MRICVGCTVLFGIYRSREHTHTYTCQYTPTKRLQQMRCTGIGQLHEERRYNVTQHKGVRSVHYMGHKRKTCAVLQRETAKSGRGYLKRTVAYSKTGIT